MLVKMSLSHQEAIEFLTSVLGMPEVSVRDQNPTLALLNDIIKQFQQVLPFQSVTVCALPEERRHLPSWGEIKESLFAKHGGLCYNLNVFMKALLDAIGYQVVYVSADIAQIDDHVTIIVSNLRGNGSKDFVEVGCGYPTFQAFSLDFDEESPEYISGFLRHKFVRQGDSFIWYHEPRLAYRPIGTSSLSPDGWYRYANIKPCMPCDIKYFESTMTKVYTIKEGNKFLLSPRAVVFQNDKLICLNGMHIIMEEDARSIEKKEIDSIDGLLQLYSKYFPQLPMQTVRDALKHTGMFIK